MCMYMHVFFKCFARVLCTCMQAPGWEDNKREQLLVCTNTRVVHLQVLPLKSVGPKKITFFGGGGGGGGLVRTRMCVMF